MTGCWLWTGRRNRVGYGGYGKGGIAHRVIYEALVGPLAPWPQMSIDHLCRVKSCVAPWHLEAVTPQVNTLRGLTVAARWAARSHCDAGHPLSGPNLHARSDGGRRCVRCQRATMALWRQNQECK